MRKAAHRRLAFAALAAAAGAVYACSSGDAASPGAVDAAADAAADAADASDSSFPSFTDGAPIDPLASDAALAVRVNVLFGSTCAGITGENNCHAKGAAGLHLQLLPDGGDVIDVPATERPGMMRVAPGDPEDSYVYLKVLEDAGIDGSRMPKDVPSFDPRLPALIHAWIEAGAPLP